MPADEYVPAYQVHRFRILELFPHFTDPLGMLGVEFELQNKQHSPYLLALSLV
jgi:hypothetical protein